MTKWFTTAGLRHRPAIFMLSAALSAPCFGGEVKIFVSPAANFASYATYQWLPTKVLAKTGIVENDPVLTPIIKAAVNRELTARGMKEVAEGGDLEVATCALRSAIPQLEAYILPVGGLYPYTEPLAAMGRYNHDGTLAVNLIDTHTKQAVWTGLVTESIDDRPGGGAKKIPKAAEKLFKKYPVKKQPAQHHVAPRV